MKTDIKADIDQWNHSFILRAPSVVSLIQYNWSEKQLHSVKLLLSYYLAQLTSYFQFRTLATTLWKQEARNKHNRYLKTENESFRLTHVSGRSSFNLDPKDQYWL